MKLSNEGARTSAGGLRCAPDQGIPGSSRRAPAIPRVSRDSRATAHDAPGPCSWNAVLDGTPVVMSLPRWGEARLVPPTLSGTLSTCAAASSETGCGITQVSDS
jgi:hypothetical protein